MYIYMCMYLIIYIYVYIYIYVCVCVCIRVATTQNSPMLVIITKIKILQKHAGWNLLLFVTKASATILHFFLSLCKL